MAGRSSISLGVGIALTVLSLLTLTLFVFTTVFFGKYKDKDRQVQQMQGDAVDVVKADERNRDDIRNLMQVAKDNRMSLVGYLAKSQGDVMEKVTGTNRDTLADLQKKVEAIPGASDGPLLAALRSLASDNERLKNELTQANAARQTALTDLENESTRISAILAQHQQTIDSLNSSVKAFQGEHDSYRTSNEGYKQAVDAQLSAARTTFAEQEQRLGDQITTLTEANLILENQVKAARGAQNSANFRGDDEASLVDGGVISAETTDKKVFINLGRKNKIVLGMTFVVLGDKDALKPDADGNYPPGKATLEVISVGDTNSTARITSETRGNPVVRGDVIANAVYDPNKLYKFVIIGNFDANRDGIATPLERQDIASLVESWGGTVGNDLAGDVDFMVVGERPLIPPQPASDAPLESVLAFQQKKEEVDRYDALNRQATATSIPALSENRLYTLIGKTPARLGR